MSGPELDVPAVLEQCASRSVPANVDAAVAIAAHRHAAAKGDVDLCFYAIRVISVARRRTAAECIMLRDYLRSLPAALWDGGGEIGLMARDELLGTLASDLRHLESISAAPATRH